MKNNFDGLINTLGTAEERISELEDVAMETFTETFKTENRRGQRLKINKRISKHRGAPTEAVTHMQREYLKERKREKEHKKYVEIITENFPK